jgi:hypothetical protein
MHWNLFRWSNLGDQNWVFGMINFEIQLLPNINWFWVKYFFTWFNALNTTTFMFTNLDFIHTRLYYGFLNENNHQEYSVLLVTVCYNVVNACRWHKQVESGQSPLKRLKKDMIWSYNRISRLKSIQFSKPSTMFIDYSFCMYDPWQLEISEVKVESLKSTVFGPLTMLG